jgi:predicted O-linked N-acetylglucosamine transferase (SPINDLY family)
MRLKGAFDHWRDIRWLSDEAACDLIEADLIDILVDLSGHTGGHRLLVLARKPAPIQIGWIGYNGTSGMAAMDYRFVDLAEPDGAERFSTESLWRLPGIAATYQPNPACPTPPPAPPADAAGHVTFGCINNFSKVNDDVLSVWAELLRSVPDSRLILRIGGIENPIFRAETEARLERLGLPPARVTLERRVNENQYDIYGQIDIALDPFPYNGVTTTMDALWMGVPVVALEGSHVAARMGLAILTNAGLPDLVAPSREEYIALARDLALDRDRLRTLRHDLRGRVARSPLVDHAALAGHVGDAFRGMWRSWVAQNADGPPAMGEAPALPTPALPARPPRPASGRAIPSPIRRSGRCRPSSRRSRF